MACKDARRYRHKAQAAQYQKTSEGEERPGLSDTTTLTEADKAATDAAGITDRLTANIILTKKR